MILAGATAGVPRCSSFFNSPCQRYHRQHLGDSLRAENIQVKIIASPDACPNEVDAIRYSSREDLDAAIKAQLAIQPEAVVVSSAAVNDYQLAGGNRW